jgi:hypothetical protein
MNAKRTSRIWKTLQLSPAAVLLLALMGNTAANCDGIEPQIAECKQAADCEGIPLVDCEGDWACDSGACVFECEEEVIVSECYDDSDCGNNQICEYVDCIGPVCGPNEPCPMSCMLVGECVDIEEAPPISCTHDAECDEDEFCLLECPGGACPPDSGGCFVQCLGTCTDLPDQCFSDFDCEPGWACMDGMCVEDPYPEFCFDDSECPEDHYCDFSADVYCAQNDADVPEGSGAPYYCGGICVPQKTCKVEACPAGSEFDALACMCIPVEQFCYDDSDCPAGFQCDFSEDVYCVGMDEDGGEADPMWCGGVCVPAESCVELPCPPGTEMDYETCTCQPLANACIISGCSGQICGSEPVDTTCEWLPYYSCFAPAVTSCGPYGPNGACMWEPTVELFQCLENHF